jgi:hypothetical protein
MRCTSSIVTKPKRPALLRAVSKICKPFRKWSATNNAGCSNSNAKKQKLAIDVNRWQEMKRKSEAAEIAESFIEEKPVVTDEQGSYIPQDLYVSKQDGITHIFDTVPSNDEMHRIIAETSKLAAPPTHIVRTYIFAGLIPPTYEWLITEESQRTAKDLEIRQPLSFDEWRKLAAKE